MFVTTAHSPTSSKYEYEKMEGFQDKPKTDIMFVVDCTGSMEGELEGIKDTIIDFAYTSKAQEVQMRLGLVEFRDRLCGEEHYIHTFNNQPFTNDATLFSTEVVKLQAEGGCGHKASSLDAILFALRQPFTTQGNKVIVLFTDALPRIPDVEAQTVEQVAQAIRNAGVQLYIVKREEILGTWLGLSYLWVGNENENYFDNNVYYKLLEGAQGKVFELGYSDDFRSHAEELKRTLMNVARTINVNVKSQSYQRGYEDGKASWSLTNLPLGYYFGSSDYWHGYRDGRNYYTEFSGVQHSEDDSASSLDRDDFIQNDANIKFAHSVISNDNYTSHRLFYLNRLEMKYTYTLVITPLNGIGSVVISAFNRGYNQGYEDSKYHYLYFSKNWNKFLLKSSEHQHGYWRTYSSGKSNFYNYGLSKYSDNLFRYCGSQLDGIHLASGVKSLRIRSKKIDICTLICTLLSGESLYIKYERRYKHGSHFWRIPSNLSEASSQDRLRFSISKTEPTELFIIPTETDLSFRTEFRNYWREYIDRIKFWDIFLYLTFNAIGHNKHHCKKASILIESKGFTNKTHQRRYQMRDSQNYYQQYRKFLGRARLNSSLKFYWCEPRLKKRCPKAYTHLSLTA